LFLPAFINSFVCMQERQVYIYMKSSFVVRWRAELCLMLYSANLPKNTGMYRNYARCVPEMLLCLLQQRCARCSWLVAAGLRWRVAIIICSLRLTFSIHEPPNERLAGQPASELIVKGKQFLVKFLVNSFWSTAWRTWLVILNHTTSQQAMHRHLYDCPHFRCFTTGSTIMRHLPPA
jgi:hypothetical protein